MAFGPQPIADTKITYEEYLADGCPVCKTGEKQGYILARTPAETLICCSHCGVAYTVTQDAKAQGNG